MAASNLIVLENDKSTQMQYIKFPIKFKHMATSNLIVLKNNKS